MRLASLLGPDIKKILKEDPEQVRGLLDEIHAEDLADIVSELDAEEAAQLLSRMPAEDAAPIFERLEDHAQEEPSIVGCRAVADDHDGDLSEPKGETQCECRDCVLPQGSSVPVPTEPRSVGEDANRLDCDDRDRDVHWHTAERGDV